MLMLYLAYNSRCFFLSCQHLDKKCPKDDEFKTQFMGQTFSNQQLVVVLAANKKRVPLRTSGDRKSLIVKMNLN